jgi:hypothetical protein
MSQFTTSREKIALNLIFGLMGESLFNRTMDEYVAKHFEEENGRLRRLVSDLSLDKEMLQEVLRKKV